jgi:hypothetical protein
MSAKLITKYRRYACVWTFVLLMLLVDTITHAQSFYYRTIVALSDLYPMCIRPADGSAQDVDVVGSVWSDCNDTVALWGFHRNGLNSDGWIINRDFSSGHTKALTSLDGYSVGLRDFDPTDVRQLWWPIFIRSTGQTRCYVLYNQFSGQCLKAPSVYPFWDAKLSMDSYGCPSPWSAAPNNELFCSGLWD